MITNTELCTDLEASRLLAETGLMAGVEEDGWHTADGQFITVIKLTHLNEYDQETIMATGVKAYRLDKILMKLPEFLYRDKESFRTDNFELYQEILRQFNLLKNARGQAAANAAAKLLWLLWKEKVL